MLFRRDGGTQLESTERFADAGESDDNLLDQGTLRGIFVCHLENQVSHELKAVVFLMMHFVSARQYWEGRLQMLPA